MIDDLFQKRGFPAPPPDLDDNFWEWVRAMGERLDVSFFDDHPVSSIDREFLERRLGKIHPELESYYAQCTPWHNARRGVEIRMEHLELARKCAAGNAVLAHRVRTKEDALPELSDSPSLFPVNVTQHGNAAAFTDGHGRLAVVNANIGLYLGCPLALGVRNYMIMKVVGEMIHENRTYASYNEVLTDDIVRAAGGWPQDDPTRHPLIDMYECLHDLQVS